ncbi:MAG: LytTR family transcriptional regulator DNA-binding domain-containing protein [Bacteroidales bacterium]|jgi:DNA-binding LytR/AlgR family response regulator|nr:LytTR family transcriptional regulator DNA-binding domain-containing protein [Bacteroidales bacterium]
MITLTAVLLTKDLLLEEKLSECIARFGEIVLLDKIRDYNHALVQLNRILPDMLFIDMIQESYPKTTLVDFINKPPFIIGLVDKPEDCHQYLQMGFFDCIVLNDLTVDIFYKKMSKIIKLVSDLQSRSFVVPVSEDSPKYDTTKIPLPDEASMFVKSNHGVVKIKFKDILFIQNSITLLKIKMLNEDEIDHNDTLKHFLTLLPPAHFLRINHSTIVNLTCIEQWHRGKITIKGRTFTVSRVYTKALKEKLGLR